MTKAEIADRISKATEFKTQKCIELVDCIFGSISTAVAEGHHVHLRKFGSFYPRKKSERIGRNPKTGESVPITARTVPCFKASKELKEVINK